jgi:amino-acid N-acetyltransferase
VNPARDVAAEGEGDRVAPATTIGVESSADAGAPAIAADVVTLLRSCELATDDLALCDSLAPITARANNGWLQGCVALAGRGDVVPLRSLAVARAARGRQLGARLVACAERLVVERGQREIYLLTETAADFFARLGYCAVAREEVAPEIRATAQFARLCPGAAVVLHKPVNSSPHASLPGT